MVLGCCIQYNSPQARQRCSYQLSGFTRLSSQYSSFRSYLRPIDPQLSSLDLQLVPGKLQLGSLHTS